MYVKSVLDYEQDIIKIHNILIEYPDNISLKNKLNYRLGKWATLLDIVVMVAKNEQKPYTSEELRLPVTKMYTKDISSFEQVGDYQAFIKEYNIWCGLLVERKGGELGCEDLYGTLLNQNNRQRFMREVARYEADPRFNRFHLIAECTYEEFLKYVPEIFVYTQDSAPYTMKKNIKQYLKRFYKINVSTEQISPDCGGLEIFIKGSGNVIYITGIPDGAEVFIDGVLRETLIMKKNKYGKNQYFVRRGASEASKIETINSLENRIQVSFVGSRARAVEKYGGLVRQWCRTNYKTILNIE